MQRKSLIKGAALFGGVVLAALAQPALAVTNITQCLTISNPGSYRLANDLKAPAGQDCIVINTFNVTLDLNGHVVTNDFATGTGIRDGGHPEVHSNITVRNGIVSGWGKHGIDLVATTNAVVENVQVQSNGGTGIRIRSGQVRNNTLNKNGNVGILVNGQGLVSGNYLLSSGGTAAIVMSGGAVLNNAVEGASGVGIGVDNGVGGATISGNHVQATQGAGIAVSCPSLVTNNTISRTNGAPPISVSGSSQGCVFSNNAN